MTRGAFNDILKFIFFVLLIPVLIGVTASFNSELHNLQKDYADSFILGIILYLIVHLLIFEPQGFYRSGQKMVADIFRFFSPLVKVAPYFLPIYSIILLVFFYFAMMIFKSDFWGRVLLFGVSFTFTMHVILTSRSLRDKDDNAVKPNYFFSMSLLYIANMFIMALLLGVVMEEFSFVNFFKSVSGVAQEIYTRIFDQLFVSSKQ